MYPCDVSLTLDETKRDVEREAGRERDKRENGEGRSGEDGSDGVHAIEEALDDLAGQEIKKKAERAKIC